MSIERQFDVAFIARLVLREKQIQQNYRPIIAVHKWFALLFRGLLLSNTEARGSNNRSSGPTTSLASGSPVLSWAAERRCSKQIVSAAMPAVDPSTCSPGMCLRRTGGRANCWYCFSLTLA